MTVPAVSVCIPVYNGERFLAAAIRSVLDQTFQDLELLILDNASTDGTAAIVESFDDRRIRVERNVATVPATENWNGAVALSTAPLVKLLCADDLVHPRCVERQVSAFRADPGVVLAACRRHMIDEQNRVIAPNRGLLGLTGTHTGDDVARQVVRSGINPIGEPGGAMFRRCDFDSAGGWRPERRYVMDLDLWMRLLPYGRFAGLPQTLAAFRIGRGSLSSVNDRAMYDEQRRLVDEVSSASHFQVRARDLRIGRLRAPAGRVRRRALFAIASLTPRRPAHNVADLPPFAWL